MAKKVKLPPLSHFREWAWVMGNGGASLEEALGCQTMAMFGKLPPRVVAAVKAGLAAGRKAR